MPVTREQIIEALRPVEDPEIRQSIVDLDMVHDVVIDGGAVDVTIALTTQGCPLQNEITQRVTAAVQPLEGVSTVSVSMTVMSDEQRHALREKLQAGAAAGTTPGQAQGHAHGQSFGHGDPNAVIPFAQPGSKTRIIGIASGKGGVGKSSVTVNLAITLAKRGHEVGLYDADVYGFSVPKMMGIDHDPVVIDKMIVPPVAFGVKTFSMGFLADDDTPVLWRGPMLHKYLQQFLTDVYWGQPDYFLIDMPPGTGDVALSMSQYLPGSEIYVVTTPQPAAQRVAQRASLGAARLNLRTYGVIENMSWFTGDDGKRYELFGRGGGQALSERLEVPLAGQIPLVPALREGGDTGAPIVATEPDGEVARAFDRIAEFVESQAPKQIHHPELRIS